MHGDLEARQIGADVKGVLGQERVVVEGELLDLVDDPGEPGGEVECRLIGRLRDRGRRQRYLEDDGEGNEEEDQQPEIGHEHDQPARPARLGERRRPRSPAWCSASATAMGIPRVW